MARRRTPPPIYLCDAGLHYEPPREYVKVDEERAQRIAAEFDRMKHIG